MHHFTLLFLPVITGDQAGSATSIGVATVDAVGASLAAASGAIVGTSTVAAAGTTSAPSAHAVGTSTVAATGASLAAASAAAVGSSTVAAGSVAPAVPTVVLTASAALGGTSSVGLTITGTVEVDDVIYVVVSVFNGAGELSSVSCSGSTNAALRPAFNPGAPLQAAWATISTGTVNPTFTVNFSASVNGVVGAIVVRGAANPTAPFDAFPGLPMMHGNEPNDAFGGNLATYSTYNNDSLLIFGWFSNSTGSFTVPSGWTSQVNDGSDSTLLMATLGESSPVSSLNATVSGGANTRSLADAITGESFSAPAQPYAVMSANNGSSSTLSLTLTFEGTALVGDIVYVLIATFDGTEALSSVSCTGSTNGGIRPNASNYALQGAWAEITTETVNPVFTTNYSGSAGVALAGIVVRGAGTPSSPFDANAAIPTTVNNGTIDASFTTTSANDLLIWGGFINSNGYIIDAPTGWQTQNWNNTQPTVLLATLASPSAVSGLSANGATSGPNPITFADAIVG